MKMIHLVLIVIITIIGLGAAYGFGFPLFAGFSFGLAALVTAALRRRLVGPRQLLRIMADGVGHTKEVMWILLLVGLLIPAWTASGAIAFLVDTGLKWLHPEWIVSLGFVFSSVISLTLGTSTGTLSAVGIPLMGVALMLGVPLPVMAGALVSGAFVGDRTSPFSSAHQLVASSTGVPERSLFRILLPTTAMAYGAALICFVTADWLGDWGAGLDAAPVVGTVGSGLAMSPWLAVPAVLLLISIVLRIRTKYAFLLGIASSLVIGGWLQGGTVTEWLGWLWGGYEAAGASGVSQVKGVAGMVDLVLLIALAGAYNGIMEETGMIRPLVRRLLGERASLTGATVRTGLFGLGLGFVSCTQTLPIMMTGRNLLDEWTARFRREHLARVTADTSLLLAALVPWNMLAILCGTILGVSVEQYVPYALFVWLPPLLTVAWSAWRASRGGAAAVLEVQGRET